jgi:hypothetical protein
LTGVTDASKFPAAGYERYFIKDRIAMSFFYFLPSFWASSRPLGIHSSVEEHLVLIPRRLDLIVTSSLSYYVLGL